MTDSKGMIKIGPGFFVLGMMGICIFGLLALFFLPPEVPTEVQEKIRSQEWARGQSVDIVKNLAYVRDERVGLCFAVYTGKNSRGDPLFTMVPCDAVKHILVSTENLED